MPLTRMQATPAIDMREKRAPTRRNAAPSRTRASASRKHGRPPIQIAAPSWCRPSTASKPPRLSRRAAAWVVRVAAASSMPVSSKQRHRPARGPASATARRQSSGRDGFHHPGDGEARGQHLAQAEIDGVHQHGGLQGDSRGLGQQQCHRRIAGDASGAGGEVGRPETWSADAPAAPGTARRPAPSTATGWSGRGQ